MRTTKLFLGVMALLITQLGDTLCHEVHDHQVPSAKAEEIRNKIKNKQWEIRDIIDEDHLMSELKEAVDLKQKGELTEEEMAVFTFRLHDFDHNEKLDGLELRSIFIHSIGDNVTDGILEMSVDATLGMDEDNDGFLSYPELRARLKNQKEDLEKQKEDLEKQKGDLEKQTEQKPETL